MKNQRGITLVSLVVTIIILIILAGISINLTLGENGIITKSKQAKEKTEQAKLNEEIALNELYMQIEAEGGEGSNVYIGKLTEFKKEIADYIEEAGGVKPEYTADTITFRESIKGIVKEVTKDATATAEDITEGKTAWVNGELIEGNKNNTMQVTSRSFASAMGWTRSPRSVTIDLSSVSGFQELVLWETIFVRFTWTQGDCDQGLSSSYNQNTGILTITSSSYDYKNTGIYGFQGIVYYITK